MSKGAAKAAGQRVSAAQRRRGLNCYILQFSHQE